MKLGERMAIWALAKGIAGGKALETRVAFDAKFAHRSGEWRRDVWQQAAERAEKMKAN